MKLSEAALKLKDGIRKDIVDTHAELAPIGKQISENSSETLRNLSLASGGLATGALVLLGSTLFPIIKGLIVAGVVFFLVEVVLIFRYLLHDIRSTGTAYAKNRKESFAESFEILNILEDVRNDKADESYLFKRAGELANSATEKARENRNRNLTEGVKINQWDRIFLGFLIAGVLCTAMGIIIPQFQSTNNEATPSVEIVTKG